MSLENVEGLLTLPRACLKSEVTDSQSEVLCVNTPAALRCPKQKEVEEGGIFLRLKGSL